MAYRVAVLELKQESNTSAKPTTLQDFEAFHIYFGKDVVELIGKTESEIRGFIETLSGFDVEILPIIAAFAVSGGPLDSETFEFLVSKIISELKSMGKIDGVLLALHGAMVSENYFDADAEILRRIRYEIGNKLPICVTMDLHANITQEKVDLATSISGFHTCPHIDLTDTGARAAKILCHILFDNVQIDSCFVKLPLVIPASNHVDFEPGIYKDVLDFAFSKIKAPIIDLSVFTVQPWLDIPNLGVSVVLIYEVYGGSTKEISLETANEIADNIWKNRTRLTKTELINPADAIDKALKNSEGPIILSDIADGTMAGSAGDSPVVLKELLKAKPNKTTFVSICDPGFVRRAQNLGAGKVIKSQIGAWAGADFYEPCEIEAEIILIKDAWFTFSQKSYFGMRMEMGLTVLLRVDNVFCVVTSNPATTTDPEFYLAVGLDVKKAQIVVVKTHVGFRDGYKGIAKEYFLLNTPGMSSDDLPNLNYKNIPRPIFPWDLDTEWRPIYL